MPDEIAFSEKLTDYLGDALRRATTPIKAVVICNPHNPLGQCYPAKTLEAVAKFCEKEDLHLLSDELYALSVFESPDLPSAVSFTSILSLDATAMDVSALRLHTMWSASKDLACNGLRVVRQPILALQFGLSVQMFRAIFTGTKTKIRDASLVGTEN